MQKGTRLSPSLLFVIIMQGERRSWETYHIPSSVGFSAPELHTRLLQPSSTHLWLKAHPPINELAIVMVLGWQLLIQTEKKSFPIEDGCHVRWEDFLNLFVHKRTKVAHLMPTKVFLKPTSETAMLSAPFGCTHLPLSHPFCWSKTYLQITLHQVTSPDVSLMLDVASYIWERVNEHYSSTSCYQTNFLSCLWQTVLGMSLPHVVLLPPRPIHLLTEGMGQGEGRV